MLKNLPFNEHVAEYEAWFEKYPFVFKTEVAAIKKLWPAGDNIRSLEIGSGTGRFAKALGILEGIEPSANMCAIAEEKGVNTLMGRAEYLPYQNKQLDVVLMNFCICYFENPTKALHEAYRVLKPGGTLILGFIDKYSTIGKYYETKKKHSIFYKQAHFLSVKEVEEKIREAGFKDLQFSQTLFHDLDKIDAVELSLPGYGKGSYILIKAFN